MSSQLREPLRVTATLADADRRATIAGQPIFSLWRGSLHRAVNSKIE